MDNSAAENQSLKPTLGLWDTTLLTVGIIVGVGIFRTPFTVFGNTASLWQALLIWMVGGLLALVGVFCFAELATTYSRSGGEYNYLTRAYGREIGFLYGWAQLTVIRPGGSIAPIAFIFASYGSALFPDQLTSQVGLGLLQTGLAIAVVSILTGLNILGVRIGTMTQNLLTLLKVLAIGGILCAGFFFGGGSIGETTLSGKQITFSGLSTATVLVLWTYSGWHEAAYVASEVRDVKRILPKALFLGIGSVLLIYLLIVLATAVGLGLEKAGDSENFATDLVGLVFGSSGKIVMAIIIMISCLGAINGLIFTSSRINSAVGRDHVFFRSLNKTSPTFGTPAFSLLIQGILSIGFIVFVAVFFQGNTGFEALINSTAAVFWLVFLLTGISLFVLRFKNPLMERPFRVPMYPVIPIIFCLSCCWMIWSSVLYAEWKSLVGIGLLVSAFPIFLFARNYQPTSPDA